MRYFFHIGYNGYPYRGWQKLPSHNSVQIIVESTLSQILKTPISVVGCGRTDSHVHAPQFFFHADIQHQWDFDLAFRLNKNLPPDIAVFDILPMDETRHARFDAFERTYDYFIHTHKDPFLEQFSAPYASEQWNVRPMKDAVALLLRYEDYKAFCKTPSMQRSTICRISKANLFVSKSDNGFRFEITANRFLSGMIRVLMGKLVKIGRGELSVDEFESQLASTSSSGEIERAYPQGLYLSKVTYPYLDLPCRSVLFNALADPARWMYA